MLLEELDYRLGDYQNRSRREQNKAMSADIRLIPTERAFRETMYKLGITQKDKQYARLVEEDAYFQKNRSLFKERNKFKLNESRVVRFDEFDATGKEIPKGETVKVYTREVRERTAWGTSSNHTRKYLEVAYIVEGQVLVIK